MVDTLPLKTDCFKDVGGADGTPWEIGEYFLQLEDPLFRGKYCFAAGDSITDELCIPLCLLQ
jgi:hypothetical protein